MKNLSNDYHTIRKVISAWFVERVHTLSPSNPITVHINDLFPKNKWNSLNFFVNVYISLIDIVKDSGEIAKPILVLPLHTLSSKLSLSVPSNIETLIEQLDEHEPPSLYLVDWISNKSVASCEEYCVPLPFSLLENHYFIYTYYREFRYKIALGNNWEFSRAVYLEYYPNGLLNQ